MTIRLAISTGVLALSTALASVAMALTPDPGWKGVGWYVVVHDIGGDYIESGPYASKESCETNRPAPEHEYEVLKCEYMGEQPFWND